MIPKCFEYLQALVGSRMQGCKYLVCVQAFPRVLKHFDLSDCPKLMQLPLFQNLPKLNHLILHQCPSFDTFARVGLVDEFGGGGFVKIFIVPKDTKCEPL